MRISDWSSDVCSSDLKRRCPLSLCAYPKKRPALRAAFLRAPISSFAGQLFDNCRILQSRDVLCDLLTFADRAQQATHDLAGERLRQVVGKEDLVGIGGRADFAAAAYGQFLRQHLHVGAPRPADAQETESTN